MDIFHNSFISSLNVVTETNKSYENYTQNLIKNPHFFHAVLHLIIILMAIIAPDFLILT